MQYDFNIIRRDAIKHKTANALSRLNTKGTSESHIEDEILVVIVATRPHSRDKRSTFELLWIKL